MYNKNCFRDSDQKMYPIFEWHITKLFFNTQPQFEASWISTYK